MSIIDIIDYVDKIRPNSLPTEQKVAWLKSLDASLSEKYTVKSDDELHLPNAFVNVYVYWLTAQIDFVVGEICRYSNDMALFNCEIDALDRCFNRKDF